MVVKYPCISCKKPVKSNQNGILCSVCSCWNHVKCGVSESEFTSNNDWTCVKCCLQELPFFNDDDLFVPPMFFIYPLFYYTVNNVVCVFVWVCLRVCVMAPIQLSYQFTLHFCACMCIFMTFNFILSLYYRIPASKYG